MNDKITEQGQPRRVPTRAGWWWATGNNHAPVEVALIGTVCAERGEPIRDDRILWVVSESSYRGPVVDAPPGFFIAPIPGPAVLAALAEYGEAWGVVDSTADSPITPSNDGAWGRLMNARRELDAAIRAERGAERGGWGMSADEYQALAARTLIDGEGLALSGLDLMLVWNALGLAGEAGEAVELVKKGVLHGHGLNIDKLSKELGDVLWYVAALATTAGLSLGTIMAANIDKLQTRYPDGFTQVASIARVDVGGGA